MFVDDWEPAFGFELRTQLLVDFKFELVIRLVFGLLLLLLDDEEEILLFESKLEEEEDPTCCVLPPLLLLLMVLEVVGWVNLDELCALLCVLDSCDVVGRDDDDEDDVDALDAWFGFEDYELVEIEVVVDCGLIDFKLFKTWALICCSCFSFCLYIFSSFSFSLFFCSISFFYFILLFVISIIIIFLKK